jgi:tripartite-type tricarboxylate transporter receptor subunit TctC
LRSLDIVGRSVRLCLCALVFSAALATPGAAADYYSGKTLTLLVGNTAGGGYDVYARLLGRYIGRHIPGEPNVVVRNQPGAGGKVLANQMYSGIAPDGLTIGMLARDNPLEPIFGNPAARFKSDEFTWLGTMSSYEDDDYCLSVRAESRAATIEDARKPGPPLVFGGLQYGESGVDLILLARSLFGLNARLIVGYPGTPDVNIAIQRGELDGRAIGMSSLQNTMGDWLRAGKLRFLVQFGRETRWRGLPDVPTARELAETAGDKALVELAEVPFRIARPFIAPPKVPAEQAAILRRAFMQAHRDPGLLKEAKDMQLDISPLPGQEVHDVVARIARTPPALIRRYKDILASR